MTKNPDALDPSAPAGGQTLRLPGSSRDAALHNQLYRYAEDLQQMVERHGELEARYETLQESCDRLMESREELNEVMRRSQDIHIITDLSGIILQCNPAASALASPNLLLRGSLEDWVLPSYRDAFRSVLEVTVNEGAWQGKGRELHLRRAARDASPLIASAQALALRQDGDVGLLHWILRDDTYLRETEFETQVSSMVFNNTLEGVMITDIDGEILAVNAAFTRITGYSSAEAIGRTPRILSSGIQDEAFYAAMWRRLREHGSWQGELYNRKKSGEVFPEWLTISAARDADGHILSYIAVFSDLSSLLQEQKRLARLAYYDALTELPNRLLFQERLEQMTIQARRSGMPFTLVFIDLDKFKPINDAFGHTTGDKVLAEVAGRLSRAVRSADTVARLGGDEFVVLAPDMGGDNHIGEFCRKLLAVLTLPIRIAEHDFDISGSLGCAEFPRHADDEATLLKLADMAMYRAKAAGGNAYAICQSLMIAESQAGA